MTHLLHRSAVEPSHGPQPAMPPPTPGPARSAPPHAAKLGQDIAQPSENGFMKVSFGFFYRFCEPVYSFIVLYFFKNCLHFHKMFTNLKKNNILRYVCVLKKCSQF